MLKGGLGNQMFQYAFIKSISKYKKESFILDLRYLNDRSKRRGSFVFRNYDLDIFMLKANIINTSFTKYYIYFELILQKLILNIPILSQVFNTYIESGYRFDDSKKIYDYKKYVGYFQSYKYFEELKTEIKKDFTLKNTISKHSKELKKQIISCESVCLNVRRADYINDKSLGLKGVEYYENSVEFLSKKILIEKIYVFSDDIEWCEKNLSFPIKTIFVSHYYKGKKFQEYFELMKSCKHFIIPNSSFAWWAAFLTDYPKKIVIVPKKWHTYLKKGDDIDLIPKEWIRL